MQDLELNLAKLQTKLDVKNGLLEKLSTRQIIVAGRLRANCSRSIAQAHTSSIGHERTLGLQALYGLKGRLKAVTRITCGLHTFQRGKRTFQRHILML